MGLAHTPPVALPSGRLGVGSALTQAALCLPLTAFHLACAFAIPLAPVFCCLQDMAFFNEVFNTVELVTSVSLAPDEGPLGPGTASCCDELQPATITPPVRTLGMYSPNDLRLFAVESMAQVPKSTSFQALEGECRLLATCARPRAEQSFDLRSLRPPHLLFFGQACNLAALWVSVTELYPQVGPSLAMHVVTPMDGSGQVKEFQVRNKTEVPLLFRMRRTVTNFFDLELLNYETGRPVPAVMKLNSFAQMKVQSRISPTPAAEFGNHQVAVYVENISDDANCATMVFNVSVVPSTQEALLTVSEEAVHFGDVWAGQAVCKTVQIKNVTQEVIHVYFSADTTDQ
eukprot:gene11311-2060_t